METTRRRRWPWIVVGVLIALLIPIAIVVVPILTHRGQGVSNQDPTGEEWPVTATATGDDGRERTIRLETVDGSGEVDSSALEPGDRFVVHGEGYDPERGIYVAICAIPDDPTVKPGPCLGGVPSDGEEQFDEGTIQFAPSNWINDDWAWKLFGARSFDDRESGSFTAYIEVPEPADENVDCRVESCGLYTRNDHTAASDRVQDLYVPVGFAG